MAQSTYSPGASDMRLVTLKIRRYQPEQMEQPYWQTFQVTVETNDRLLDVLNKIKWEQDGTLTFRRSCPHGVCGSDAMRVNGRNRLACKLLMGELGSRIIIEAMLGYPVIRDLVVDVDPFFAKYEKIKPYLINDEPPPRTERLQSPEERARSLLAFAERAAGVRQLGGRDVSYREAAGAFAAGFAAGLRTDLRMSAPTPAEVRLASELAVEKYAADEWTHRR